MQKEELISKILKSEAFTSLNFESIIRDKLNKKRWDCIQSPYYLDIESNKYRELDIVARKKYMIKVSNNELTSEINLLIESKSLSGYHIIFDGKTNRKSIEERTDDIWMGLDHYLQHKRLLAILNKTQSLMDKRKEIINYFNDKYFPDNLSIFSNYSVQTFKDIELVTSFRETKFSVTKELDNSVLWKAFQSLNSSAKGFKNQIWENIEDDLIMHLNYIEEYNQALESSLDNLFTWHIENYIKLHKILVIDANLWLAENQNVSELKYCRLLQNNMSGYLDCWIDTVNHNHFEEYVNKLTDHYEAEYLNTGMKIFSR